MAGDGPQEPASGLADERVSPHTKRARARAKLSLPGGAQPDAITLAFTASLSVMPLVEMAVTSWASTFPAAVAALTAIFRTSVSYRVEQ